MADKQKLAYRLAATISGAGVAAMGAAPATGAVDMAAYPTSGTSGQQRAIMPEVKTVSDTYSKTEIDAKLELQAEKARRADDGLRRDVRDILKAVEGLTLGFADLKGEVRDDNKQTRTTIITFALGSLGVVITVAALVWGAQGNMTTQNGNVLAAFGAGRDAADQAAAARQAAGPAPKFDDQTGKRLAQ